jgi:hypothetical protein
MNPPQPSIGQAQPSIRAVFPGAGGRIRRNREGGGSGATANGGRIRRNREGDGQEPAGRMAATGMPPSCLLAPLLAAYRELDGQISQLDTEIAGLRHKQALLIGLMNSSGLSYRSLAPLLGISKSRVHQFTVEHGPVPRAPDRLPGVAGNLAKSDPVL